MEIPQSSGLLKNQANSVDNLTEALEMGEDLWMSCQLHYRSILYWCWNFTL